MKKIKGALRDLAGLRKGRLVFIKLLDEIDKNGAVWLCQCDCGNKAKISSYTFSRNHTFSCGCLEKEKQEKLINSFIGKRFGRLTVIRFDKFVPHLNKRCSKARDIVYLCLCDCGKEISIRKDSLMAGARSCGCLTLDLAKERSEKKTKDLIGKKFGMLTVLSFHSFFIDAEGVKRRNFLCQCMCGNKCVVGRNELVTYITKSCGCLKINKLLERIHKKRKDRKMETGIEKKMRLLLTELGIEFKQEYVIPKISVPDFYLPNSNIVIYCDGDWHHRLPGRREADYRINRKLRQLGYEVLRFWESEIDNNLDKCQNEILQAVK